MTDIEFSDETTGAVIFVSESIYALSIANGDIVSTDNATYTVSGREYHIEDGTVTKVDILLRQIPE